MSKLNDLCEGNTCLKNKIVLVEKQKDVALQENNPLKRKIDEKEKIKVFKKKKNNDSHSLHALHATTNEMKFLKNKINCLSSTLSKCAFTIKDWNLCFKRNKFPMFMHIIHIMHMNTLHTMTTLTLICILECTLVHIVAAKAI